MAACTQDSLTNYLNYGGNLDFLRQRIAELEAGLDDLGQQL